MKKVWSLLVLAAIILWPQTIMADASGTCGDNLTWTYTESTKNLLIEGTGDMENYFIAYQSGYGNSKPSPWYNLEVVSAVIGPGVTSIGNFAFASCSKLTGIYISNGVTSFGNWAFYGCKELASITIPNSVVSIGYNAFANCSSLTSITIPSSVTSLASSGPNGQGSIKSSIFYGCIKLSSIKVENGNSVYDSRDNCNAIIKTDTNELLFGCQNTVIPNSVTSIGDLAFTSKGLTAITIPNSVTNIGCYAFEGCTGLSSIIIPNSVTSIKDYAFADCKKLTSVTLSTSLTSIKGCTFRGCSELASITIPNSVTEIESFAFEGCTSLSSINTGDGVKIIGYHAFMGCLLSSITIGKNVTNIGEDAFYYRGSTGPSSIIVVEGNTYYDSRNGCNAIIETASNKLLYGCMNTVIPNDVTSIRNKAFLGCTGLTSLSIPNSVKSIGEQAFYECTNLAFVKIGNGVTTIGQGAFLQCSSLTSVTIGNSVKDIEGSAFGGCIGLTSVAIPNSVENIGNSAFNYCQNLESVTIGNSIKTIGDNAFSYCTGLKDFYSYAEQIPTITSVVFQNTSLLNATLHVPASVLFAYQALSPWKDFGSIVALTDDDPKPTEIKIAYQNVMTDKIFYTIDGKQTQKPQRGLNIIRMKDGTTRKVVKK